MGVKSALKMRLKNEKERISSANSNNTNIASPIFGHVIFSKCGMNPQQFALPRPTILYMIKAQKSLVLHRRFMKLCKYIYDKNRIVPVSRLHHGEWNGKAAWTAKWDKDDGDTIFGDEIDLVNGDFKLWILETNLLMLLFDEPMTRGTISTLIKMTYRCDCDISLVNIVLSLDEFKFLSAGRNHEMRLAYGSIIDELGLPVPIKEILEFVADVKTVKYYFLDAVPPCKSFMLKEVYAIISILSATTAISAFEIYGLNDKFDIDAITPFLMATNGNGLRLNFNDELSPEFVDKLEGLKTFLSGKCGWDNRVIRHHTATGNTY